MAPGKTFRWAWSLTSVSPRDKLVLICIADLADITDDVAVISDLRIAEFACCSITKVRITLKRWERIGVLSRVRCERGEGWAIDQEVRR